MDISRWWEPSSLGHVKSRTTDEAAFTVERKIDMAETLEQNQPVATEDEKEDEKILAEYHAQINGPGKVPRPISGFERLEDGSFVARIKTYCPELRALYGSKVSPTLGPAMEDALKTAIKYLHDHGFMKNNKITTAGKTAVEKSLELAWANKMAELDEKDEKDCETMT